MKRITHLACLTIILSSMGCVDSSVQLTGTVRNSITAEEVRIYTSAPSLFEEVAQLRISRRGFKINGEKTIEKAIDDMRLQAAKLGANGLLLEDFSDSEVFSVATGVGSDTDLHNGSISLGFGSTVGVTKKTGTARAIFIQPAPP